jgi:hypothetical protein
MSGGSDAISVAHIWRQFVHVSIITGNAFDAEHAADVLTLGTGKSEGADSYWARKDGILTHDDYLACSGFEFPGQIIFLSFGQDNRQTNSVIKNQHELMSRSAQGFEDFCIAPHLPRDGANRGAPLLHDPITDMTQCDLVIAKQRAMAVAMECHPKPLW